MTEGDPRCVRLDCGHPFHEQCIVEWYANNSLRPRCPACRQEFHLSVQEKTRHQMLLLRVHHQVLVGSLKDQLASFRLHNNRLMIAVGQMRLEDAEIDQARALGNLEEAAQLTQRRNDRRAAARASNPFQLQAEAYLQAQARPTVHQAPAAPPAQAPPAPAAAVPQQELVEAPLVGQQQQQTVAMRASSAWRYLRTHHERELIAVAITLDTIIQVAILMAGLRHFGWI